MKRNDPASIEAGSLKRQRLGKGGLGGEEGGMGISEPLRDSGVGRDRERPRRHT